MGQYIRYTEQEIADARQTDMIDFLGRQNGYSFIHEGASYRCREHNSLVVNADRKQWYWNSQHIGGNNVIDWLCSIENLDFKTACGVVISKHSYDKMNFESAKNVKPPEKKPFKPPTPTREQYKPVYCYLAYTRNINPEIITYCFDKKIVYQDEYRNAVFMGYDYDGLAKFCEVKSTSMYPYAFGKYDTAIIGVTRPFLRAASNNGRAIYSFSDDSVDFLSEVKNQKKNPFKTMKGRKFRINIDSSDKCYSFHIDATEKTDRVFVFEAPIDLLAHATINNMKAKAAGSKNWEQAFLKHNRLSLSGTSDVAITPYLSHHPEVKNIVLCLDNDEAGRKATEAIASKFQNMGYTVTSIPSKLGKDYSEYLDIISEKSAGACENSAAKRCKK